MSSTNGSSSTSAVSNSLTETRIKLEVNTEENSSDGFRDSDRKIKKENLDEDSDEESRPLRRRPKKENGDVDVDQIKEEFKPDRRIKVDPVKDEIKDEDSSDDDDDDDDEEETSSSESDEGHFIVSLFCSCTLLISA